eukprot:762836-Hanusia_phi.AAC.3
MSDIYVEDDAEYYSKLNTNYESGVEEHVVLLEKIIKTFTSSVSTVDEMPTLRDLKHFLKSAYDAHMNKPKKSKERKERVNRGPTRYNQFVKDNMEKVKLKYPTEKHGFRMKKIGEMWQAFKKEGEEKTEKAKTEEQMQEAGNRTQTDEDYDEEEDFIKGKSQDVLRKLEDKETYDLVYVDGDHTASAVMTDAILAYPLLKRGGILIFDDYLWNGMQNIQDRPMLAVNAFLEMWSEDIDVLHVGYQA